MSTGDLDMPTLTNVNAVISPNPADAEMAKESGRSLTQRLGRIHGSMLEIRVGECGETVQLPQPAVQALLQVLTELGQGHSVTITPIHAQLSSEQAAELLNVSRPYLVKLIDEGSIPSRKVGVQRRLLLEDVIAYKKQLYAKQLAAMAEMTQLNEEMGLYDEPQK
jgi:excisionase family DNA binding protein